MGLGSGALLSVWKARAAFTKIHACQSDMQAPPAVMMGILWQRVNATRWCRDQARDPVSLSALWPFYVRNRVSDGGIPKCDASRWGLMSGLRQCGAQGSRAREGN